MSANSVLLDFSLDPTRINDEVSRKDIVKLCKEHLEKFISGLKITYDMLTDDGYLCILNAPGAIITTIRFFNQGLITINIEYYRAESEAPKITFEVRRPFLLGVVVPNPLSRKWTQRISTSIFALLCLNESYMMLQLEILDFIVQNSIVTNLVS